MDHHKKQQQQQQQLSSDHYCSQCNKSFTRIRDRIRHENSVHIRKERFQCSHCEKTFTRRDSKVRHAYQCLKSMVMTPETTVTTATIMSIHNYNAMDTMIIEQPQPQHKVLPTLPPITLENQQESLTLPPILNKERFCTDPDDMNLTTTIMVVVI
ncbi:hypothetical protein BDA99DRAFT_533545 [Phascolomyces articulosus]|uniref:C2H2-type domain-containing protein n=1 Tax=Phascolomyces articulosus TaxID=60185 RepID=A0AAD5K7B7_9FUNG|nr:hypothetical protein BDA99DRAFT_533545 [Phascolomyces articulosus]